MHKIKLVSKSKHQLKPIVEAALTNELRLIEVGIRKSKQILKKYEDKYQLKTQDFIADYENDKMDETMDFIEWIGEFRMFERLNEKADTLRSIRFEN